MEPDSRLPFLFLHRFVQLQTVILLTCWEPTFKSAPPSPLTCLTSSWNKNIVAICLWDSLKFVSCFKVADWSNTYESIAAQEKPFSQLSLFFTHSGLFEPVSPQAAQLRFNFQFSNFYFISWHAPLWGTLLMTLRYYGGKLEMEWKVRGKGHQLVGFEPITLNLGWPLYHYPRTCPLGS